MDLKTLPRHWHSLCHRLQISPEEAQKTWQGLQQRYSEPHRHYHTLEHIAHCLTEFSTAKHLAENPDLVRLAIYFHDSVYDVQRTDNERQSAQLAVEFGKRNSLDAVARLGLLVMILETEYHNPHRPYGRSLDSDAQLLQDVDLSSLALPWDEFCENTRKIREEYRAVVSDDEMFRQGRRAFFARLLAWPSLYLTDFFKEKYEEKARENLRTVVDGSP